MKLMIGAQLNRYTPKHQTEFIIDVKDHEPLSNILNSLNIPANEVHLVIINGLVADLEQTLVSNEDHVMVYPYITGG
jgi:hypothetical protein